MINAVQNCTKSGQNGNKSAQIFSGYWFHLPMGDTNATPVPVNPSRFATNKPKSWEAESPPSWTTVVVRYLCHQLTPSLRISSLAGAKCSRSSSIRNLTSISARCRRRFQIRQSSERKHPETAVGNMRHFRGHWQDLENRLEWMLSGENNSSLSAPHDKFSIHAHINHLCRMLFPVEDCRRTWRIAHW